MIARSELGRRRGSLTLLAILVAVSSAVTLAGFAGARRTDSVLGPVPGRDDTLATSEHSSSRLISPFRTPIAG